MVHIMKIDEMIHNNNDKLYVVRSVDNWSDDRRWEVVVKINNDVEYDKLDDMFYDNSNGIYEFHIEGEYGDEDLSVFGKPISFQYFKRAFNEQCHGKNTLHKYMEKTPVGQMYENNMYWSEELREEMIELSDEHLLWKVGNDFDEDKWNNYCIGLTKEFENMYETELFICGRSGRHVCVKNTLDNRIRFQKMVNTVDEMQKTLVNEFSK